jgi:hypothetical protein
VLCPIRLKNLNVWSRNHSSTFPAALGAFGELVPLFQWEIYLLLMLALLAFYLVQGHLLLLYLPVSVSSYLEYP